MMNYTLVPSEISFNKVFTSTRHNNVSSILHVNPEMEVIIVTCGSVVANIGNSEYQINSGYAAFIMPFEPHSFKSVEQSTCHVLLFSCDIIRTFFDFLAHNRPHTKCFKISDETIALINKILPNDNNEVEFVDALACIAPICSEIKNNCSFTNDEYQYDDVFLNALSIANKSYNTPITLESVAKKIGVSPVTLSRKFTENASVNFNAYINSLRCSSAAKLILNSDATFTEISYSVGFGSIRNFNRNFLRFFNCTPSEFKAKPHKISNEINIQEF